MLEGLGCEPPHARRRSRLRRSRLALAGAAALAAFALTPAAARAYVYWANWAGGTIGRANLDGSAANQRFISGLTNPEGLAVDSAHVYWADYNHPTAKGYGSLGQANVDGSGVNPSFIALTSGYGPFGVAVDGSHIYWANQLYGTLSDDGIGGGTPNNFYVTGANDPNGVAVDGTYVYWANAGSNSIGRAPIAGGPGNPSFITGANVPVGVAVDGTYIYWTNAGSGTIGRALLNGSGANQSFIAGANHPQGVAVDASHVYWTNTGTDTGVIGSCANSIGRANLDGSSPDQSFITGADCPVGIAVDQLGSPTTPGQVTGKVFSLVGSPVGGYPVAALGLSPIGSTTAVSGAGGSYSLALPAGDWFVFTTWAAFAPTMPNPFPPTSCPSSPVLTPAEQAQLAGYQASGLNLGCVVHMSAGGSASIDFREQADVRGVSTTSTARGSGVRATVRCPTSSPRPCQATQSLSSTVTTAGGKPVAVGSAAKRKHRTVGVGTRSVTVQPGHSVTFVVVLNGQGTTLLKRFGKLPVTDTISLRLDGKRATLAKRRLTLKPLRHRKH